MSLTLRSGQACAIRARSGTVPTARMSEANKTSWRPCIFTLPTDAAALVLDAAGSPATARLPLIGIFWTDRTCTTLTVVGSSAKRAISRLHEPEVANSADFGGGWLAAR